jgi:uncharacterized protein
MAPDGAASPTTAGLLPLLDDDSTPFWDGCAMDELRVQRCARCHRRRMPPRPMCPWCRSLDSGWEATSGRGRVWSYVVPHPPLLPAYAAVAPYNVIVVELEEDPLIRFVGNLVATAAGALDEIDPTSVRIGTPVVVCFAPPTEGIALPRWRLVT